MKKKSFNCVLTLLLLSVLLLTSCSDYSYEDFYGGSQLSEDALESIEQLMEETSEDPYAEVTDENGIQIYFWTAGGSAYHRSLNCSSLKKSKSILSGSIDQALEAGKTKACSNCND